MLEVSEKSGTLVLSVQNGEASFSISRGRVVAAAFGEYRGADAVYVALKCSAGSFAFTPQNIDIAEPEISVPTTVLLMEGCRLLDEGF